MYLDSVQANDLQEVVNRWQEEDYKNTRNLLLAVVGIFAVIFLACLSAIVIAWKEIPEFTVLEAIAMLTVSWIFFLVLAMLCIWKMEKNEFPLSARDVIGEVMQAELSPEEWAAFWRLVDSIQEGPHPYDVKSMVSLMEDLGYEGLLGLSFVKALAKRYKL